MDEQLCKYFSECPNGWEDIRVVHLLSHSSGLPDLADFPPCLESTGASGSTSIIAALSRNPLLFKPGSRFRANKLDYYFVDLLIERISAQSTSAYLRQHIFLPLKLARTNYSPRNSHLLGSSGTSQTAGCPQGQSKLSPIPPYFAEQIYTTVQDLYLWNKALLGDQFLPKTSADKMFTPYVEGHGFGWKIVKEFDRRAAIQNEDSGAPSISDRLYPDDATCIVVVSIASGTPATNVSHDLGAILFGKFYPSSPKPEQISPP